jgi:hypothetical protein
MNEVMMVIKRFNCEVLSNEMQLFCLIQIGIPKATEENCVEKFRELYGVQLKKLS